jgi:hypothetical protein
MGPIIITNPEEFDSFLNRAIKTAYKELQAENENDKEADKLYTVNQVRKRLGKAHATVSKLISNGMIKTTKNGLVSEASLREYLQKN